MVVLRNIARYQFDGDIERQNERDRAYLVSVAPRGTMQQDLTLNMTGLDHLKFEKKLFEGIRRLTSKPRLALTVAFTSNEVVLRRFCAKNEFVPSSDGKRALRALARKYKCSGQSDIFLPGWFGSYLRVVTP